jgi:hypothetical protein
VQADDRLISGRAGIRAGDQYRAFGLSQFHLGLDLP